jgi:alkylation response protein AidB-like acyl-CoA dehydrogenase
MRDHHLNKGSALREALLTETVAKVSPGVAVAILAHIDLGLAGIYLFGSEYLQKAFGVPAKVDNGEDFRQESSLAKYLAVEVARKVTVWAADLFGAASVINDHPIHKFPLDAWAASLGEGTQDVQKLIIFRELVKKSR